jgi:ADP-ribosylglycohydrolase
MQSRLYDHILGSLAVAGMGDALGAATEQWSTREIYEQYGGPLRTFRKPPPDTFSGAEGNELGQITDDTSQMYYLAETLIQTDGNLTTAAWVKCLLRWADQSPHVGNMGPTTRLVVEALRTGGDPYEVGVVGTSSRQMAKMGATNGSSMRVAPAGLVNPGNIEGACQDALTTCLPSHNTQIAISAACAIAAGVAQALTEGADVFSVVQACLAGARRGEELAAEKGRLAPGPSTLKRTELAITLALKATSLEEALASIEAYIGNSVDAAESIPAAIGLFVFAGGDPLEAIVGGTNIGNDTDTIAAIAGALAGALRGISAIPQDLYETFKAANQNEADVETLAQGLTTIAQRRIS